MSSNYTQEAVLKAVMERLMLNPSEAEIVNLKGSFSFNKVKFVRYNMFFGMLYWWSVRFDKDKYGYYRKEINLTRLQKKRTEQLWRAMKFEHLNQVKVEQHKRLLRDAGFDNV